jgi:adenylyltransferase/sulfurtransferase
MKNILILLAVFVLLVGCTQPITESCTTTSGDAGDTMGETKPGYIDVSPSEAKGLIDNNPDLIILDVSPAYDRGHLPGAINYYIGDGSLDNAIPSLDRNAMYLVYCHVDSASIGGAQKLIDAGFTNVYRLEGNYRAWVDAGYPTEK